MAEDSISYQNRVEALGEVRRSKEKYDDGMEDLSGEEQDKTVGRLMREHREVMGQRLHAVERVKQIADALRKLAAAMDRRPDFEKASRDSILHEYLDLSKIGALLVEESELSAKQEEYAERLRALGFNV